MGVEEPIIAANLGRVCRRRGDLTEAERWLGQAVQGGNLPAADDHAAVLAELHEFQERNQQIRQSAEAGDADAAYQLAMSCAGRGQDEEAESWLRKAAQAGQAGQQQATTALAQLLLSTGRAEEAVTYCRPAAAAGDREAAWLLVMALDNTGNTAQTKELAIQRAEIGDAKFMTLLGVMLADDRPEEAATWWQRAATLEIPILLRCSGWRRTSAGTPMRHANGTGRPRKAGARTARIITRQACVPPVAPRRR